MIRFALCLLPSLANAACPYSATPPAEFDYPPTVPVYEYQFDTEREIGQACAQLFGAPFPYAIAGCGARVVEHTDPPNIYGVIIFQRGCLNIRRHELGHANGWVH